MQLPYRLLTRFIGNVEYISHLTTYAHSSSKQNTMATAADEQAVPVTDYVRPSRNTWYDEISIKWRSKPSIDGHQEPCYFLEKLPAELRNRIYADVLVPRVRRPIEITTKSHPFPRSRSPGLLRTCKQIKGEAAEMRVDLDLVLCPFN